MLRIAARYAGLPLAALAAMSAWAGDGLRVPEDALGWPRWQARVGLSTPGAAASDAGLSAASPLPNALLLGDYYFTGPGFGAGRIGGGLRATSGLVMGSRSAALGMPALASRQGLSVTLSAPRNGLAVDTAEAANTTPYVGVGYSGVSLRGGWGFSADLGVMAVGSGSGLRIARPAAGSQTLDDLLRDMRLTPVLQLGVSYSF